MEDKELLKTLMLKMLKIREFEESISKLCSKKALPGWLHLSLGQEAVAAGICTSLQDQDWVISGHRAHGHAIAKGIPLKKIAAELFGKEEGCCRGRGGSMHLIDPQYKFFSTSFVGSGLPIAVGLALSFVSLNSKAVAVSISGEGSTNTGAFHEALNLASIWGLPVVFVIENNQYSISTHISKSASTSTLSNRAMSYEIPGISLDGNDVIEVYNNIKGIIDRVRRGGGPALVECRTFRLHGHYEGEQWEVYRTQEEVQAWMSKDPLVKMGKIFLENGFSRETIEALEKKSKDEVAEAIAFANNSQYPDSTGLTRYIFQEQ